MLNESTSPNAQRRLFVVALCFTVAFALIVAKLIRYQAFIPADLEQMAQDQLVFKVPIPTKRGIIQDATGHALAVQIVQWDISASPTLIAKPEELANQLAQLLDMPRNEILSKLEKDAPWVPLASHVPYIVGEQISDLGQPGIMCEPKSLRYYSESDLFAHMIGIVNDTGDGFYGVEGYHNPVLKGANGEKTVEQNPVGGEMPVPPLSVVPPRPGTNLVLTVDRNIQYIAREELMGALAQYGASSGTVIVMAPKTGAILAAFSYPTYNPNDFAEADISLLADPAVSKMWEPGSIFKIITWGAGLDSGTISPGTVFYDEGALEVGGRVMKNWDRQGHGLVTMTEGLAQSLNTVASFISTSTGKERFYNYVRRFGFGQLVDVDLASEGPGMVKLPGDAHWFPSELGTNSFGQGIAVTPIQMITAVGAVANKGMLMKPYVVQQFVTQDESGTGERVIQVEPKEVRRSISEETAETLTNMLVRVVEDGATMAQVPGYRIAGKTGTAQIPTAYGYHPSDTIASFVGYAPADDPQFIILVKLDKPQTSPWGSQTAAPAFQSIAERLFVYMQIPPDSVRLAQRE